MKRIALLSCLLPAALGACASAEVTRERGLHELRTSLDLNPPVGRVVGDRLLHTESGLSLLRVPTDGWQPGTRSGRVALFEGSPGMALVLDGDGASVVRMKGGHPEWAKVFEPTLPAKVVSLHTVDADLSQVQHDAPENATADELAAAPEALTLQLDVPHYAAGATATFNGAEVVIASGGDDGDTLLSFGRSLDDDACGGGYHVSLDRGVTTDGASWFHIVSELVARVAHDECTAEMRSAPRKADYVDGSTVRTTLQDVWFVFPADGGEPRVVASESSDDEDYVVVRTIYRDVRVPGGHIELRAQVTEAYQGEDGWSWTLYNDDGDAYELVTSD